MSFVFHKAYLPRTCSIYNDAYRAWRKNDLLSEAENPFNVLAIADWSSSKVRVDARRKLALFFGKGQSNRVKCLTKWYVELCFANTLLNVLP